MGTTLFIIAAVMIVAAAVATGNGPALLKSLETGLARGIGYQVAHELIGARR
jgi:hypothetical protein